MGKCWSEPSKPRIDVNTAFENLKEYNDTHPDKLHKECMDRERERRLQKPKRKRGRPKAEYTCWICGRNGHYPIKCPERD